MSTELSELFDRDPLKLTDQDIKLIVARQREAQIQFELGVKAPKPKAAKAKTSKGEEILKDLGLI
jgi:hypothetical protein